MKQTEKVRKSWILWGILISLTVSAIMNYALTLQQHESQCAEEALEKTENFTWLYQSTFLLYRDLYNLQNNSQLDYEKLYLHVEKEWPDDEEESYIEGEIQLGFMEYFQELEEQFNDLNKVYDYAIRDDSTGKIVTNVSDTRAEQLLNGTASGDVFLFSIKFDANGNASIGALMSENSDAARKTANAVLREQSPVDQFRESMVHFCLYGSISAPKDCTVTYALAGENLEEACETINVVNAEASEMMIFRVFFSGLLLIAALGMLVPSRVWGNSGALSPYFEVLAGVAFCSNAVMTLPIHFLTVAMNQTTLAGASTWLSMGLDGTRILLVYSATLLMAVSLFMGWYVGTCLRRIFAYGAVNYVKEKSLVYRFFPFIKEKVQSAWDALEHLDVTKNAHRMILKIVLINAGILFLISCLWYRGFAVTIVYSILLYFVLRKYISTLQKKYRILLAAENEMAKGNLNVVIREDLGVFEPFRPELLKIQSGFRKAVDEEVKSQKLKAELITNVSHDLKTPLTAIITYVNLLKDENITEEQRKEYLDVLERKSIRLKVLIEDLFEVSKANSQNITLNLTNVDIMSLVKQVAFEMSDKLEAAGVDLRMNLADEKLILSLDSQKTYRIYENLFGNIAKYAMKGTRVYINGFRENDRVILNFKNISAQEITVDSADLTERFVRGDASRNTEGSGLGLAIAKSFTELQGGELAIDVDGDLFKVTTTWKLGDEEKINQ